MIAHRATCLKDAAGVDLCEALVIHAQDFRVAVVCRTRRQLQLILQIKDPAGDALCVLTNQGAIAGRDFYLVEIVPGLISIVQADVDRVGFATRHSENLRANAFHVS